MKNELALSAAAIALLLASVGAHAGVGFDSDTLTVGPVTVGLGESLEPGTQASATDIALSGLGPQFIGTHTITLTDPGTTDISDIVSATIHGITGQDGLFLDVTLTSDAETPLLSTGEASFVETGKPQDLTGIFGGLFGTEDLFLPTIQVTSDVSDVPEPSTWAMMLLGLAGIGYAGYRARRSAVAAAH
jgi:hypothetical protein